MIYDAYVLGAVDAPKHLARLTHEAYFEPKHEEFAPRTAWSLQRAFPPRRPTVARHGCA